VSSTHFPKLAYKKLIKDVTHKLSNAYSLLQIKDHNFYCMKKREYFLCSSGFGICGCTTSQIEAFAPISITHSLHALDVEKIKLLKDNSSFHFIYFSIPWIQKG
jgi:hypothetical protein